MLYFLLLSFCVVIVSSVDPRVDPLVLIDQGLVRGLRSSDGSYSSFLGIPYASVDLNNPFGVSKIARSHFCKINVVIKLDKSFKILGLSKTSWIWR